MMTKMDGVLLREVDETDNNWDPEVEPQTNIKDEVRRSVCVQSLARP